MTDYDRRQATFDRHQATWDYLREENALPSTDITLSMDTLVKTFLPGLGTVLSWYTGDGFKSFVAILDWVTTELFPFGDYGIIKVYVHDDNAYEPGHWTLRSVQEVGSCINWRHVAH